MNKILKSEIVKYEFKKYFDRLGGLHDSVLKNMLINFNLQTFELVICDPLANFEGYKEYEYIENVKYTFYFDTIYMTDIEYDQGNLFIYDVIIKDSLIEIVFSPCGKVKTNIKYFICEVLK